MKILRARLISVTALLIFSSLGSAVGQSCFNWMIPEYSTYSSASTDGINIYSSVVVDGTTGGTCNQNNCGHCSQILNPPPVHTPKAYNLLGSTGGWGTGTGGAWNSYISYTNNQQVPAQSTLVPFQTEGKVICSAAGLLYDVLNNDYEGTSPNCGSNGGQIVTAIAPPQTATCDAKTTNIAASGLGGSAIHYVTDVTVTTSTDNVLLIDLLGGPSTGYTCTNKQGGTWCYNQNFKAAVPNQYTGKTGNIDWNYSIFCGAKQNPDIAGTVPQKITCP